MSRLLPLGRVVVSCQSQVRMVSWGELLCSGYHEKMKLFPERRCLPRIAVARTVPPILTRSAFRNQSLYLTLRSLLVDQVVNHARPVQRGCGAGRTMTVTGGGLLMIPCPFPPLPLWVGEGPLGEIRLLRPLLCLRAGARSLPELSASGCV